MLLYAGRDHLGRVCGCGRAACAANSCSITYSFFCTDCAIKLVVPLCYLFVQFFPPNNGEVVGGIAAFKACQQRLDMVQSITKRSIEKA